jgi:outer membrane immunogenic protein
MLPGASIKLGGELAGGGSRNGFEDSSFNGRGVLGGASGQFTVPLGGGVYGGFGASVLGGSVSGTSSDPVTSSIRVLVPIDGIVGTTVTPGVSPWPVSLYGFGGLVIGDVNVSAPPFSATQTMTGWSAGVGADLQLSPTWSVGVKYRHFDLGNANFSVFPGATSLVTERGDMVSGTLSYRLPISW